MQHGPTAAALSTSFFLNHALNSSELNTLITKFRVQQREKEWVTSQKDWRNQAVTSWILGMHYNIWVKNAVFVFPHLPGSAEAQVIWGATVSVFWLLTLLVTLLSKISKSVHAWQSYIASQRWAFFSDTVFCSCYFFFPASDFLMSLSQFCRKFAKRRRMFWNWLRPMGCSFMCAL